VRILVFGYNALDVTVPIRGALTPDGKHEVDEILLGGGGPGATAAVALSRLGAEVRLVTVFGDDLGAQLQRAELLAAGVDVSRSVTIAGHPSARAVILVDEAREQRTILWTRGSLPLFDPGAVDSQWLEGCDLLYCDGHDCAAAGRLAGLAREKGLKVLLDGGSVRDGARELVGHCTDVISSRGFAPALTGVDEVAGALRALRALGPDRVALTCGAGGCLALDGDAVVRVPAYAVSVRDTTGAGDAFHAGYAYALVAGRPWLEALDFGAATAALKCRGWGGRRGLPTLGEVDALRAGGERRAVRC
jgi:sulfofructose kinase